MHLKIKEKDDAVQDEPMQISTDENSVTQAEPTLVDVATVGPSGAQENCMVLEDPGKIVSPSVRLQYLCSKRSLPRPGCILVDEIGPSHLKLFTSACIVDKMVEKGSGLSKSHSRRQASDNMILRIQRLSNKEENKTVKSFKNTSGNIHISALQNYCSANVLPQPCFTFISEDGPLHRRIFTFNCKVENIVEQASGYNKAEAKHRAAEMVLKKLKSNVRHPGVTANKIFGFSVPNNSTDQTTDITDHPNDSMIFAAFVERLIKICVKNGFPRPIFNCKGESGPPHLKEFTIECRVGTFVECATATKKRVCKNLVARQMIDRIKTVFDPITEGKPIDYTPRPVQLLQRYCSAKKLSRPIFTFISQEGPDHKKSFIFECKVNKVTAIGFGKSISMAKHIAAINVLRKLVATFDVGGSQH